MVDAAASEPKPRVGRTAHGRRQLRGALAVAALDLFVAQGYEATTVEEIVEVVGVGRRTFFRYFRSKEAVVFPDHQERLTEVVERLEAADETEAPLAVVARTAELVLDMYLAEPEISLKRFELTRQVPSLRDTEIASIDRYQRVFARYLRHRYADQTNGQLRAAVAASAVVAAHNHVLRDWLKSGGTIDAHESLRRALRFVTDTIGTAGSEHVVVSVVRTEASAAAVSSRIEDALGEFSGE